MDNLQDATDSLLEYLGDSISGAGSTVVLTGAPILCDQVIDVLAAEAEGMGCQVAIGNCHPESGYYAPVLQAVTDHLGGVSILTREDIQGPFRLDRSFRIEFACLETIGSACRESPVLLVLKNLQSADLGTTELLRFLSRNIGDLQVMVLATVCGEPIHEIEDILGEIGGSSRCHFLHVHDGPGPDEVKPAHVDTIHLPPSVSGGCRKSQDDQFLQRTRDSLEQVSNSLRKGHPGKAAEDAEAVLARSRQEAHHGAELESLLIAAEAGIQAGAVMAASEHLRQADRIAWMINDASMERRAHLLRAMLCFFCTGEPDLAKENAQEALELSANDVEKIPALAILSMAESVYGRQETAEGLYCEAAQPLSSIAVDSRLLERALLALAAALLLERRHQYGLSDQRFDEAVTLAGGTEHPIYWKAVVTHMRGRSLARRKRFKDADKVFAESAELFDRLGNTNQARIARRPVDTYEEDR